MCPSLASTHSSVSCSGDTEGGDPHSHHQGADLCPFPSLCSSGARFEDTELERLKFVDSIKTYKSKAVS